MLEGFPDGSGMGGKVMVSSADSSVSVSQFDECSFPEPDDDEGGGGGGAAPPLATCGS